MPSGHACRAEGPAGRRGSTCSRESRTGNGIVTSRTFLGQLTRLRVRLSGDVEVQVDQQSTLAAGISPGDAVEVTLRDAPVLLAERR